MPRDDKEVPDSGATFTFGRSRFDGNVPSKFWICNDKAVQVSCGDDHSCVIAESGRAYVFGCNAFGQLGLGHGTSVEVPTCVKALKSAKEKVMLAACGKDHTILATASGKLYSCGSNSEYQLGVAGVDSTSLPVHVKSLTSQQWKMLAAGTYHSVALTESGEVYVWGTGEEGQLGLSDVTEQKTPAALRLDEKVTCVACGSGHTLLVTASGRLLVCGEAESGKISVYADQTTPLPVSIDGHVIAASGGGYHSLVLTDDGAVYSFGGGSSGQLGRGDIDEDPLPERVPGLEGLRIISVSCGQTHSALVSDSGDLYMFGEARNGMLCKETDQSNEYTPYHVTRFADFHVDAVALGGCHSLVLAHPRVASGITAVRAKRTKPRRSSKDKSGSTSTSTHAQSNGNVSGEVPQEVLLARLSAIGSQPQQDEQVNDDVLRDRLQPLGSAQQESDQSEDEKPTNSQSHPRPVNPSPPQHSHMAGRRGRGPVLLDPVGDVPVIAIVGGLRQDPDSNVVIEELPDDHPVETPRQFVEMTPRTRRLAQDQPDDDQGEEGRVDEQSDAKRSKYVAHDDDYFPRKNLLGLSRNDSQLSDDSEEDMYVKQKPVARSNRPIIEQDDEDEVLPRRGLFGPTKSNRRSSRDLPEKDELQDSEDDVSTPEEQGLEPIDEDLEEETVTSVVDEKAAAKAKSCVVQ